MGAPKNNQYWKMRSKHGRDRIIESPEVLAKASDEYFQWCVDNPIIEHDWKNAGRELVEVEIKHPRVFKKEEFARFCNVAQWRTIDELKDVSEDFLQIVTHIEGIIADQKYTYAVVGMFNSSIVAKDLGLKDRVDHTTGDNPIEDVSKLSTEELIKRAKASKDIEN